MEGYFQGIYGNVSYDKYQVGGVRQSSGRCWAILPTFVRPVWCRYGVQVVSVREAKQQMLMLFQVCPTL